jgi:hypothetical protein
MTLTPSRFTAPRPVSIVDELLQASSLAASGLLEAALGLVGGRGRGSQWLGVRSLPVHPLGMVSSRQRETRTVPAVPSSASNMRILVPSFGAVLIGCHFGNMPDPPRYLVLRTVKTLNARCSSLAHAAA